MTSTRHTVRIDLPVHVTIVHEGDHAASNYPWAVQDTLSGQYGSGETLESTVADYIDALNRRLSALSGPSMSDAHKLAMHAQLVAGALADPELKAAHDERPWWAQDDLDRYVATLSPEERQAIRDVKDEELTGRQTPQTENDRHLGGPESGREKPASVLTINHLSEMFAAVNDREMMNADLRTDCPGAHTLRHFYPEREGYTDHQWELTTGRVTWEDGTVLRFESRDIGAFLDYLEEEGVDDVELPAWVFRLLFTRFKEQYHPNS